MFKLVLKHEGRLKGCEYFSKELLYHFYLYFNRAKCKDRNDLLFIWINNIQFYTSSFADK